MDEKVRRDPGIRELGMQVRNTVLVVATPKAKVSRKIMSRPSGGYRIRVGDYRILYTVDIGTSTVLVSAIGHQKEVYH